MILQVREPLLEPVEPLLPEATEQVEKKMAILNIDSNDVLVWIEQVNVVDLEKEDAATDDPAAIHMWIFPPWTKCFFFAMTFFWSSSANPFQVKNIGWWTCREGWV